MSVGVKQKRGLRPAVSKGSGTYREYPDGDNEATETRGKQYNQTGAKYTGPNYPKPSVTGALQDGRSGGGRAK